jgi:hypothetical protein
MTTPKPDGGPAFPQTPLLDQQGNAYRISADMRGTTLTGLRRSRQRHRGSRKTLPRSFGGDGVTPTRCSPSASGR